MNAPFPRIGSAHTFAERISRAKAARNNGDEWTERFHLDRIHDEATDSGDTEWADAAQYAIDAGDYGEADWLIEQELREEHRAIFPPGIPVGNCLTGGLIRSQEVWHDARN